MRIAMLRGGNTVSVGSVGENWMVDGVASTAKIWETGSYRVAVAAVLTYDMTGWVTVTPTKAARAIPSMTAKKQTAKVKECNLLIVIPFSVSTKVRLPCVLATPAQ